MKIIFSKKWKEMQENHNRIVKNNIDMSLEIQDLRNENDIYREQVEYLQQEIKKLKEKYEKKTKKTTKKVEKKEKSDKKISKKSKKSEK